MSKEYSYPALLLKQTAADKPLVLFAAPAPEIDRWAAAPQKRRSGNEETVGFQREQNPQRIESLTRFFANDQNIIQNPLLCAARVASGDRLRFEADGSTAVDSAVLGTLVICSDEVESMPFQEILLRVQTYLEDRVPELKGKTPSESLVASLKERARTEGLLTDAEMTTDEEIETEGRDGEVGSDAGDEETEASDVTSVLFEESHIADFWEEIAARHEVAQLMPDPIDAKSFLGMPREGLKPYITPLVLVDGQHRLGGAVAAGEEKLRSTALRRELEERILKGEDAGLVERELLIRESRRLPISLLLSPDPSEQVFQFVVVNQKATPIGKALLGTIVSTTLSNEELARVATRLKDAGIELEESQAVTFLARHPSSPFYDRVERGMTGDAKNLLPWNVLASLVTIFRELRGGRLFHTKTDLAAAWADKYLATSQIVERFASEGFASPLAYWGRLDGPWRDVFIAFWSEIRARFSNTSDPDKPNYWGNPRESNLFNKVSLTILASDFFQFLVEMRRPIHKAEDVHTLVEEWLLDVNLGYFDKDWNLSGVKKDSTGIRNQWAYLWVEYRKYPRTLPDRRLYRSPRNAT